MNNNNTTYHPLGDYIRPVDVRNRDLKVTTLVGLTIEKCFIPSVANIIGTDLSNYKVIKHGQFACSLMQVSRDGKIPVAMFTEEEAIMSPAYPMFEIASDNLLPEYLMMWFSRPEFDREASYYAVGGVRGSLTWEDFCAMRIPVPPISEQRAIVADYEAVARRIAVAKRTIATLQATAQALYRKMFVDGIDKENLPEGWRWGTLGEVCEYVTEKIDVEKLNIDTYISAENMVKDKGGVIQCISFPEEGRCTKFQKEDILLSNIRPYFKKLWKATFEGGCSNDVLCIRSTSDFSQSLIYNTIENDNFFDYVMAGSNGVKMPRGDKNWIMAYPIIVPDKKSIKQFDEQTLSINTLIESKRFEINKSTEIQTIILSGMGR